MIARLAEAALGLLYPRRAVCMGCGSAAGCDEDWICPECRQALAQSWIGAYPPIGKLDAAAAAYAYRGAAAGIVRRFKYSGIRRLTDFMSADMVRACRAIEPIGADVVTCVPMHARRLRLRGCNHAELLARACAEALYMPYEDLLTRVRSTP